MPVARDRRAVEFPALHDGVVAQGVRPHGRRGTAFPAVKDLVGAVDEVEPALGVTGANLVIDLVQDGGKLVDAKPLVPTENGVVDGQGDLVPHHLGQRQLVFVEIEARAFTVPEDGADRAVTHPERHDEHRPPRQLVGSARSFGEFGLRVEADPGGATIDRREQPGEGRRDGVIVGQRRKGWPDRGQAVVGAIMGLRHPQRGS